MNKPMVSMAALWAVLLFLAGAGLSAVKPAAVFADRMVLQRECPVNVWGTAAPQESVTVEFAGQTKTAAADAQGNWLVRLDPLPASAEPREMAVTGAAAGTPVKVRDVLVGEVWVCAGGFPVARRLNNLLPDVAAAVAAARAESVEPKLRLFSAKQTTAREPQADVAGGWTCADLSAMPNLPAEGYYVGRDLVARLGVPVGIVSLAMAWPEQPLETWVSREALATMPAAKPILDYYASDAWKLRTATGPYEERLKAWMDYCQKLPLNPPPKPHPNDTVESLARQEPSSVWNAMVAPLTRLTARGVIWDHGVDGESLGRAVQYGQLLPAMIGAWRQAFGNPALPFVVVQARPAATGADRRLAAELRDAQREGAVAAKAAVVVSIDLPKDPHPRETCSRITDVLLAKVYKKEGAASDGPELSGAETVGNKVILRFRNTQGGLVSKGGGPLKGFAVASSLFRWVWADAVIKGDAVEVSAPTVEKPEGVRYAYQDAPERGATLSGGNGCPAAPFRTDTHLTCTGDAVTPGARLGYNARCDLGVEDAALPRILIIGDSISGHYINRVKEGLRGKANVIGESSMTKGTWASMGPRFYRSDMAARGDELKTFLAERGPFDIVHFNNGIHDFYQAKPGSGAEAAYAERLRKVVATIRESGAQPVFANSTGTLGDNKVKNAPHYLTNCKVFNAAAEKVMAELNVPVTDIYGATQPRIEELISPDMIHLKAAADPIMADAILARLNEALEKRSPKRKRQRNSGVRRRQTKGYT